jgi:hypothetical protein
LTLFEEFMLLDGPLPMDIWLEAGFMDPVSRGPMEEAVAMVGERHPFLTARVEERKQGRFWVLGEGAIPLVFLKEGESFPRLPLDPRVGLSARVCIRNRTAYIQVHHACCDGVAARAVIQELAAAYAEATRPGRGWPRPPSLDPGRLLRRGSLEAAGSVPPPPPAPTMARDILEFLFPFPRALAAEPGADPRTEPPYSLRVLDPVEASIALAAARTSAAGRSHEKALSDCLGTLGAWQRRHGEEKGRIRVLIPWDLRTLADRRMPACNHMSFAFLNRPASACTGDLSVGLHAEHEYIRQFRTDLDFLRGLEIARRLGYLRAVLRLPVSLSTAVFTNMGDATPVRGFPVTPDGIEMGDNIVRYIVGVAPVRTGTRAALGLCRLGGRLAVVWRSDRRYIGQDAERWLLDDFTRRLAAAGTPAPR